MRIGTELSTRVRIKLVVSQRHVATIHSHWPHRETIAEHFWSLNNTEIVELTLTVHSEIAPRRLVAV